MPSCAVGLCTPHPQPHNTDIMGDSKGWGPAALTPSPWLVAPPRHSPVPRAVGTLPDEPGWSCAVPEQNPLTDSVLHLEPGCIPS